MSVSLQASDVTTVTTAAVPPGPCPAPALVGKAKPKEITLQWGKHQSWSKTLLWFQSSKSKICRTHQGKKDKNKNIEMLSMAFGIFWVCCGVFGLFCGILLRRPEILSTSGRMIQWDLSRHKYFPVRKLPVCPWLAPPWQFEDLLFSYCYLSKGDKQKLMKIKTV